MISRPNEWGLPLWLVSLDVSKAFDRVGHQALFNAFELHGVSGGLISVIKLLYNHLTGRVDDSKRFPIDRGVKQGDILSPVLPNAIMRDCSEELEEPSH